MALCHRYYPSLVAIGCAVLGDGHLAEDAAQESLAKACRRLDGLKEPRRFGAWLARICRNEAADLARRTPKFDRLGDHDPPADPELSAVDVEAVRLAIDRLPDGARELLYLRYRSGLSYEEMSSLLGVTPQAVNGRLRRAKQAVKESLQRRQNGRP